MRAELIGCLRETITAKGWMLPLLLMDEIAPESDIFSNRLHNWHMILGQNATQVHYPIEGVPQ